MRNSPGKSVQARQAQRGEQRDAHQPAENRRGLAQAAEIVQPAQAAAALLDQADKIKQSRRRQAVVEHLQDDAVERRGLLIRPNRAEPSVNRAAAKMPSRQ